MIAVGVFIASRFQPVPDSLANDALQPVSTSEEPPPSTQPPEPEPSSGPEPESTPEPEPPPEPARVLTAHPVRMQIPALLLDYEIEMTISDRAGNMQILPVRDKISWFDLGAIPGNEGNAIFGGHNIWRGERSQLFDLDKLMVGDEMIIDYDDGTSLTFMLESVFVYPLISAPAHLIMDVHTEPRVTLITCKPPFNPSTGTSDFRIVATFREESVFIVPDPPVEPFPLLELS
jgi:hypothetical protein